MTNTLQYLAICVPQCIVIYASGLHNIVVGAPLIGWPEYDKTQSELTLESSPPKRET